MTTKTKQFSSDIEAVRRPLEAWRRTRQNRDRIPEPLWAAMAKLARTYGVSLVSGALRVDHYALKDRVVGSQKARSVSAPSPPTFVELKAPPASQPTVWLVELEDGSGSKMTLRLDPGSAVDALAMVQAFWRRTS